MNHAYLVLLAIGTAALHDTGRRMEIDVIAPSKLDAAVIGTPNHLHHGPAMILLQRKVPFVLEKPMATTEQACRDPPRRTWLRGARATGVRAPVGAHVPQDP